MATASTRQAAEVYTKGTKAWFADELEAWVSTTCISNTITEDKVRLVFEGDNDQKEYVFESTLAEIEKTGGSKLPPLRNPPKMEYTDDLTNLSYLNEPAVLNTIRTRYLQHLIYTYSGIVLIAMNPFDRVALYDPDIVQQYSGRRRGELEPHLFAIAEDAYRCMIREQTNQTIVVSGESGAGKTVSAKYIMRYFATADDQESSGKRQKSNGGMTEVEEQILATNPIMEAFGNAKTTRNDNSSRFGKYIEIQFDDGANIIGAKIRTYLLERSRLIFQPETERNYHIFYQLCAAIPLSEKKEFELGEYNTFHYLNQSGTGTVPGVDDAAEFEVTQRALSTVGLSVQLQWKIFRLLAALLHIGNIQITGRGDAMLAENDPALLTATRLLGIKAAEFRKWIVRKQIITRSEKIVTNLNPTQAHVVKDSVAKYVYANLFDWLVGVINDSLSCPDADRVANFIGVLDIYGFEHFKKNSFEQFCINYANEKLQQQFNQHVFKLEQEEYVREKINWTFIEFSDNQKCIELIEAKLGILSLLDEESRLPAGTDQGFCQKLYTNFDNPSFKNYFKKPRFSNTAFTIAHYAHDVQYESENFLDKNKDTVPDEHLALLQGAEFDFLKEVLEKAAANNPAPVPENNKRMSMVARKPTLGSIFKLSLINLMDTIGGTNVHYIRCIKPNEAKVAWAFEANMVLSQLRACGVLETIRISCAGYPSRWTFEEFADRYYALVSSKYWDQKEKIDIRDLCSMILDASIKDQDKYQLAYLEKLRSDRFNECAVLVQKNVRRFVYRTRYLRMKELTIRLQCIARRKAACVKLEYLRRERAAIVLQKYWRRFAARKEFLVKRAFILKLQTVIRAHRARSNFSSVKENTAAIQIQRLVRGWFARKHFKTQRELIIHLQSCIRRRVARKQLFALRAEARSVNHFKEVSYALENKVVELTQTLTTLRDEKKAMGDKTTQLETHIRTWMDKYEKLERKAKGLEERLAEPTVPQAEYDALQAEKNALNNEYKASQEKTKSQEREIAQLKEQINAEKEEKSKIQEALREANEKLSNATDEAEVAELKNQNAALKAQLAQALHSPQPRRQQSTSTISRGLSPNPRGGRSLSPAPTKSVEFNKPQEPPTAAQVVPVVNVSASKKTRRNSSAEAGDHRQSTKANNIEKAKLLNNNPRPTSIDHIGAITGDKFLEGMNDNEIEEEVRTLLRDEEALHEEISEGLIKAAKVPFPSVQNPPSHKEIFYPANVITMCVEELWHFGCMQESERLLFTVMDTIQKQCLSFTLEESIYPCPYWLSNVHELLSLICATERKMEQELFRNGAKGNRTAMRQDFRKLVDTIKFELQCLEDNIFHAWMKEMKKCLQKMVIPAVIESQCLPGFIVSDLGRTKNKRYPSSEPLYSLDDLLHFLNKVWRGIKCYRIESSVLSQAMTELLKFIGVTSFNDLLLPMQIQYNVTRLEEWCKSHEIPEGTVHMEHVVQTAKLLLSKKSSPQDIDLIYEMCWILSPTQIQRIVSQYHNAEYENAIDPSILKVVASHVISGDQNDVLLLDSVPVDQVLTGFEIPMERTVTYERYLPSWLNLKRLRRLTQLTQASRTVATDDQ
ncbi:Myosin type-2 heavy chain 1 [Apophysomyces ossiformis]|uniref:Myosin type-2 heavy chain 1 n=1 Tax=Apophysomyces ossiformis TaxID=679940 RepID=A0A8H7BII1_9FUNG|nr:Myosin type-2 heavy chain 1 [Apophysomyces ossiformis]